MERYALLWLLAAAVVLLLAIWTDALNVFARSIGIVSGPNALFLVAVGFILLLLLHFSAAMSRLTDQTKVLAQRHAILEQEVAELRAQRAGAGDNDDEAEFGATPDPSSMLRSSAR
jgi:hypothetical protein